MSDIIEAPEDTKIESLTIAQIRDIAILSAKRAMRLNQIAGIIEAVDNRCMATDGPVTPTLDEMRQEEISRIYWLATEERP